MSPDDDLIEHMAIALWRASGPEGGFGSWRDLRETQRLDWRVRARLQYDRGRKVQPPMSTTLSRKVFDYLWEKHSEERKNALQDLSFRGLFTAASDDLATTILESYLNQNPRSFCSDGIQRLRDAVLVPPVKKGIITLEVAVPDDWHSDYGPEFQMFTQGSELRKRFQAHLNGHPWGRMDEPHLIFKDVQVTSCKWADK